MNIKECWDKVCERLKTQVSEHTYRNWIAVIKPVSLDDKCIILEVENDFYQLWIEENYLSLIKENIYAVVGKQLEVVLNIGTSKTCEDLSTSSELKNLPKSSRKKKKENTSSSVLNPKFKFSNFIVGPSNNFAHAAALAVAQAPAKAYNPLFIYGATGLGKTHLMQAIGHYILDNAIASICYVSSETFINEYITALQERKLTQFRNKYRGTDVLLIDDIHFLAGKTALQEEFFHTFNVLFDSWKQIVLTSDRPASEINNLEQRLVTRFNWGLVTELEAPDFETRVAILKHRLKQSQVQLSEDVIVFIAQNIRSNIRTLEGALNTILSYSALTNTDVDVNHAKHLLADKLKQEKISEITFEMIQRVVAQHFDIRLADMTSKTRAYEVALPRQIAMYLCRKLTSLSFPAIANSFAKTHATVLHACKTIQDRIEVDPSLQYTIRQICRKLGVNLEENSKSSLLTTQQNQDKC